MIELKDLRKSYTTGSFVQKALDGVSINFRENEFVAVLGQSGSGKTTLLNVLGGLDRADSGDIIINGTSTHNYKSADWDTYRNHRIGFIFQSYNLIPHQSVLSNVELALTLAGIPRAERKARAKKALEQVGLGEHINKKPNQLSGGQMQRVAIARALVNNPEIVLADEPTGALDTETGLQVMNVLKTIANDRLVIMVTHNPDLASEYATRIVRLQDGRIIDDSDPFNPQDAPEAFALESGIAADATAVMPAVATASGAAAAGGSLSNPAGESKGKKRASMSFATALALSFTNLMTKKGRTFMTAFAGSIGIIGIAAILSLSNGVNNYIAKTEQDALSAYPLIVTKSSFDFTSMMTASAAANNDDSEESEEPKQPSKLAIPEVTIMSDMFAKVKNNNLSAFKEYLESEESGIAPYVNTIQYSYGITPRIYLTDTSEGIKQLNPSSMGDLIWGGLSNSSLSRSSMGVNMFNEMLDNDELVQSQMEVVEGRWPEEYDEVVLVISQSGRITDYTLYSLGFYDPKLMDDMAEQAIAGEDVEIPDVKREFTIDDAMDMSFTVVPSSNLYQYNSDHGTWTDMSKDTEFMEDAIENGIELKVVGVVKPLETANTVALSQGIAYKPELTKRLMDLAVDSEIVSAQMDDPDVDVFTGKTFDELSDSQNNTLDFGSMFSVDEAALSRAFNFDTSALSNMNMDLDLSGMNFDPSQMNVDMSQMSIDTSMLNNVFDANTLQTIMAGAPQPDFSQLSVQMDPEKLAAVSQISQTISAGFLPYWYSQHPGESVTPDTDFSADLQAYMQTEQVLQQQAMANAIIGETYGDAIQQMMSSYMENQFIPYLQSSMQQMLEQAAQAMAQQMTIAMQMQIAAITGQIGTQMSQEIGGQLSSQMSELSNALQNAFSFDANAFASAIQFNMTQEDLTSLLTNYMNAEELSYRNNLAKLGYASLDDPETISIYPIDFQAKESVLDIIDGYNDKMRAQGSDDNTIMYSDIAGALMSSVTDIVDKITMILIAFVSISLVVSSIMIGIITYISVLERKKEIGILRAMGASKGNIANVFNAETVIIGLISGVFAIAAVLLVSIPVNAIVESNLQVSNIMILPATSALALIGISVLLTFVAGLMPSQSAARRDPVEALRSE